MFMYIKCHNRIKVNCRVCASAVTGFFGRGCVHAHSLCTAVKIIQRRRWTLTHGVVVCVTGALRARTCVVLAPGDANGWLKRMFF